MDRRESGPHKAKGLREMNRHWPVDKIVPEKRKNRPLNMCSADFSVNRETMGKKPVAFPVGVQWNKQGEDVHTF